MIAIRTTYLLPMGYKFGSTFSKGKWKHYFHNLQTLDKKNELFKIYVRY